MRVSDLQVDVRGVDNNWAAGRRFDSDSDRATATDGEGSSLKLKVDIILNDGDEGISDATGGKLSQVGGSQGGGEEKLKSIH
ncbi:hypothetical protein CCUS01_08191 [Colletotrichum cuscutae]|uniref:Uncharacterized protein n=1 Tax=Colletotrichum cuscutae TaxID=1209917 RepID=A0AAI9XWY2_9PEZI|nr:hypothetical protein CCUS01_08191 [Colletotrichum cuscutae]